jgi:hypothetical protein
VEAEERPASVGDGPSDEEGGVEKLVQIRIIHGEGQKRVAEGLRREGELGDGGAGAEGEEGLASLPTGAAVVGWGEEGGGQVRVPSLDSVSVTVSLPSFIIIDSRNCCSAESGDAVSSRSPTRA